MAWACDGLWVSAMRSEKSAYSAEDAVAEGEEEDVVEGELKCVPNRAPEACSGSASGSPAAWLPLAAAAPSLGFGFGFR